MWYVTNTDLSDTAVLRMGRQTANDETQEGYLRAMGKYYGSLDEQTLKDQSSEVLANVSDVTLDSGGSCGGGVLVGVAPGNGHRACRLQTMDLLRQYRINISGEVSALLVQMFVLEVGRRSSCSRPAVLRSFLMRVAARARRAGRAGWITRCA